MATGQPLEIQEQQPAVYVTCTWQMIVTVRFQQRLVMGTRRCDHIASCTGFQCGSVLSSTSPPWFIRRCLGALPATLWLTTAASSVVTDARPRRLHSANTRTLIVSRTRLNFNDTAFIAAELSGDGLQTAELSYSRFRHPLKTFLFG